MWDLIFLGPTINVLIMLSHYLGDSFGLAIIVLTLTIRLLMYPLTMKQLRASKAMQSLQVQISELRKKYAKDKQQLAKEQMKLYKESGMNPAGCLLPMLIQLPVWIALYQSITRVLAAAPEAFLDLSQHLYSSWPLVFSLVPLESKFLGVDMATFGDVGNLVLAVLVGGTMWVQQKMMMVPTADPKQQAQSQTMLWMMPMMFAFFTLTFPSGLALYWVTSNVISIAMQYFVTGWGGLTAPATEKKVTADEKSKRREAQKKALPTDADITADVVEPDAAQEGLSDDSSGDKRQDRGGSYPTRLRTTRGKPGGSRGHGRKRR